MNKRHFIEIIFKGILDEEDIKTLSILAEEMEKSSTEGQTPEVSALDLLLKQTQNKNR